MLADYVLEVNHSVIVLRVLFHFSGLLTWYNHSVLLN